MILFACDFDDTLYFHDGRGLLDEDVKAIADFQKDGNLFVLCTGRPASMKPDIERMTGGKIRFDYEIYSCGAMIRDDKGAVLYEQALDPAFVRYALESHPELNWMMHHENGLIYSREQEREQGALMESIDDLLTGKVYEMSLDYHKPAVEQALPDLYGRPEAASYRNKHVVDFIDHANSKATAIERLASRLGIDKAHTAAMGDSFNDISMLAASANGFTFTNADEDVRQAADYLASGVAQALAMMEQAETGCPKKTK